MMKRLPNSSRKNFHLETRLSHRNISPLVVSLILRHGLYIRDGHRIRAIVLERDLRYLCADGRSTVISGPAPRQIDTIVCAFTRDELPTSHLQIFRRFEHAVAKAGWKIRVRLEALEEMPPHYDVLVVPPELRDRALARLGDAFLFVTTRQSAADGATELLREIARGDVIAAERADPNAPRLVTHRGMVIL